MRYTRRIAFGVFLFFILFGSIALALGISQLLDSAYAGFLVVAGIYLLIGILIAVFNEKWIKEPVSNGVIKTIFKSEKSEHPEH